MYIIRNGAKIAIKFAKNMNITLIGMAGVGKSFIGKHLAERLNCTFVDIDEVIEKKTSLTLQQIIDTHGEEEFLKIEERAILRLNGFNNSIISPGGSIIYSKKAMDFLKEKSIVIYLEDSLENIKRRIKNPHTRGLVGFKNKDIESIFEERCDLYEKYADATINLAKTPEIDDIIAIISKKSIIISKQELKR